MQVTKEWCCNFYFTVVQKKAKIGKKKKGKETLMEGQRGRPSCNARQALHAVAEGVAAILCLKRQPGVLQRRSGKAKLGNVSKELFKDFISEPSVRAACAFRK